MVHAALYLVVVLAGAAALFLLLGSEFVGITQVLIYIGAVIVLFLFGIMLTRAPMGKERDLDHPRKLPALLAALIVGGRDYIFGAGLFRGRAAASRVSHYNPRSGRLYFLRIHHRF